TGTGDTLKGDTLDTLARKYVAANAVIQRLSNWMDIEALHVLANGLALDLDTPEAAAASAASLKGLLHDALVTVETDPRTDKLFLKIARTHHGNVRASVISADFVHGADY